MPVSPNQFAFEAIGTHWRVDLPPELPPPDAAAILDEVTARVAAFERTYSRFRDDSFTAALARRAGEHRLPADAAPLFTLYRRLYDATAGAFTPLIGQALAEAGYDATYSFQPCALTAVPAWDDVMRVEPPLLHLTRPVQLDFGAAGKGYLVDLIAGLLADRGLTEFTVDAGGDLRHFSASGRPLRIGLEHPADPAQAIGVATLGNAALCGSAGNRRRWANFHHTIDPRTLASPRGVLATWTVAATAAEADALTTCLFLVSPDQLTTTTFDYLILNADYTVNKSPGFPAEVFTEN